MPTYPCTVGEISPDADALVGILAGTPAVTFGTSYVSGTASTFVRTDDILKFPQALKATGGGLGEMLLTDNGAGILFLTPTTGDTEYVGNFFRFDMGIFPSLLQIEEYATADGAVLLNTTNSPPSGALVVANDRGTYFAAPLANSLNPSGLASNVVIETDFSLGSNQSYCLKSSVGVTSFDLSARTIGTWDSTWPSVSGIWTGATVIVGYDMSSAMSLGPSATSGTALKAYGARLREPSISTTNGGWTETAGFTILSGGTTAGTTITKAAGGIIEMPRQSTTLQVGLDLVNVAGGTDTPTDRIGIRLPAMARGTNRYGVQIAADTTGTPTLNYGIYDGGKSVGNYRYSYYASGCTSSTATACYGYYSSPHSVGTDRWSYWGSNKFHCDASDFIANASGKGFSNRDSQSSSAGGGGTARYWRMLVDASATGVAGDVTLAIDSAGAITATRAGGATGTVLLKLVDVGTAPVTA